MMGQDQYIRGVWEYFPVKDQKFKSFERMPKKEKQEEIQGQRQRECRPRNTWNK